MADIVMCNGGTCPMKKDCYRYNATPNPFWQSYAAFKPDVDEDGLQSCKHFWPLVEEES